jgi:predicted lipoprotein with Yx(FWY)xxD motif
MLSKRRSVVVVVAGILVAASLAVVAIASSTKTSTVALRSTAVGKVLVAANGRTLYLFTADKRNLSNCYGQCAVFWPPLIATKPSVGTGLHASMLGTTKRKDGKLQVTYGGHPLYLFIKDTAVGDINGQGFVHFGGTWWVVSARGGEITTKK